MIAIVMWLAASVIVGLLFGAFANTGMVDQQHDDRVPKAF